MTQNLDFKSLLGENEPVKPPFYTVYKNLFSLKFETGSYLIMEKFCTLRYISDKSAFRIFFGDLGALSLQLKLICQ